MDIDENTPSIDLSEMEYEFSLKSAIGAWVWIRTCWPYSQDDGSTRQYQALKALPISDDYGKVSNAAQIHSI